MGSARLKRAVFFDRDGVLNEAELRGGTPHPPASAERVRVVAAAAESVRRIHGAGYLAIVVTNQPDVARGTATRRDVEAINAAVAAQTGVDAVYTCYHDDDDACTCRKPKTGLIEQAARDYGVDVRGSFVVGDRARDVRCGRTAGCTTVFLDLGYPETPAHLDADFVVSSLPEAVDAILGARSAS